MTKLDTLKKQAADLEAKLEESTEQLKNMKAEIKRLENGWEMKCPYTVGDEYYYLSSNGKIYDDGWDNLSDDVARLENGNIFPTKEAAELEVKRRNLLTRFRSFRDECNGDWKADWTDAWDCKFFVSIIESELEVKPVYIANDFVLFGYFKNPKDAERAIELFGDEIKELFVEGE